MNLWKNVLAFLLAPLGAPVSLAVWSGVVIEPRNINGIISALPGFLLYAAPTAYSATLLLGIPAYLFLLHKKRLILPIILLVGALIGTITGLVIGFYIAGYDLNQVLHYFAFDLMSIYAPSTISGIVSSFVFWVIRTILMKRDRKT